MAAVVKRKRGRPRLDEPPEVNEFDISLIQEFQRRPVLYDRNHPQYRNRETLEPQWAEMADNLGLNVTFIKNRMMQLRNRYNLERRRVEALQEQYKSNNVNSPWALYSNLDFLGDHIKTRRPFQAKPQKSPTNSSEENEHENGNESAIFNVYNSTDTDRREGQHVKTTYNEVYSSARADCQQNNTNLIREGNINNLTAFSSCDKFKAFGQFLTSSLIEMNESEALRLIEKFTSELVKSLASEQKPK